MLVAGLLASLFAAVTKTIKSTATSAATQTFSAIFTGWTFKVIIVAVTLPVLLVTGGITTLPPWRFVVANAVLVSVYTYLITKAFQLGDLSVVGPLQAFSPVFATGVAILWFDAQPSLLGLAGIGLVIGGAYIGSTPADHSLRESLLEPVRALLTDRSAVLAILAMIVISPAPSIDKLGIHATSPAVWMVTVTAAVMLLLAPFAYYTWPSRTDVETSPSLVAALIVGGLSNIGILLAQYYAFSVMFIGYVLAIKRLATIFTFLAGVTLFKERDNLRNRTAGTVLMFVGAAVIGLATA